MYPQERRRLIAELIAREGHATVQTLAAEYDVAAETIRRDLGLLDEQGLVERVHGGAVAPTTVEEQFQTLELPFDERELAAPQAKLAIAQAALQFLPSERGAIFLDSGTTVQVFAKALIDAKELLHTSVVTNCVPIARHLTKAGLDDVTLLGGQIRPISEAVVGTTASRMLSRMRADVAFIGTNGLTTDHGLSTPDAQEAAIKSGMIDNAYRVVVLADSSKLNKNYLVSFGDIDDIDVLITDRDAPTSLLDYLRDLDVEVIVVEP